MSYTKRQDITAQPDEQVVELDDGLLVAVRCDRSRSEAGIVFDARARALEADGTPLRDTAGTPIATRHQHAAGFEAVDVLGADAIARDCLLAVLGEPPEVVAFGPPLLSAVNIRRAVAAAPIAGPVDVGGVL